MPSLSRSEIEFRQLLQKLGLPVGKPPGREHIWLENGVTKELKVSNCRSWSCERCAPKMSALWAGKILEEHVDYFLTITQVPEVLETAMVSWRLFAQAWRRRYGDFEAVKFTERGKKNQMKHYHVLIRCCAPSIDLDWMRLTLEKCGYGMQNKIRRFSSDEHRRRTVWYCAKYSTKSGTTGFLETERKVNTTQGFFTGGDSLTPWERMENQLWKMKDDLEHTHWIPEEIGNPTPVTLEEIKAEADLRGLSLSRTFMRSWERQQARKPKRKLAIGSSTEKAT